MNIFTSDPVADALLMMILLALVVGWIIILGDKD